MLLLFNLIIFSGLSLSLHAGDASGRADDERKRDIGREQIALWRISNTVGRGSELSAAKEPLLRGPSPSRKLSIKLVSHNQIDVEKLQKDHKIDAEKLQLAGFSGQNPVMISGAPARRYSVSFDTDGTTKVTPSPIFSDEPDAATSQLHCLGNNYCIVQPPSSKKYELQPPHVVDIETGKHTVLYTLPIRHLSDLQWVRRTEDGQAVAYTGGAHAIVSDTGDYVASQGSHDNISIWHKQKLIKQTKPHQSNTIKPLMFLEGLIDPQLLCEDRGKIYTTSTNNKRDGLREIVSTKDDDIIQSSIARYSPAWCAVTVHRDKSIKLTVPTSLTEPTTPTVFPIPGITHTSGAKYLPRISRNGQSVALLVTKQAGSQQLHYLKLAATHTQPSPERGQGDTLATRLSKLIKQD